MWAQALTPAPGFRIQLRPVALPRASTAQLEKLRPVRSRSAQMWPAARPTPRQPGCCARPGPAPPRPRCPQPPPQTQPRRRWRRHLHIWQPCSRFRDGALAASTSPRTVRASARGGAVFWDRHACVEARQEVAGLILDAAVAAAAANGRGGGGAGRPNLVPEARRQRLGAGRGAQDPRWGSRSRRHVSRGAGGVAPALGAALAWAGPEAGAAGAVADGRGEGPCGRRAGGAGVGSVLGGAARRWRPGVGAAGRGGEPVWRL
uniref:putative HTLV-1-related endogenous sequence n=1 Tax=Urocitellus parryii TaxID=9999 RepID=UPI000E561438|nr:putative HTLV-1-related endogenous sequence [Urocitellus parryii]